MMLHSTTPTPVAADAASRLDTCGDCGHYTHVHDRHGCNDAVPNPDRPGGFRCCRCTGTLTDLINAIELGRLDP